MDIRQYKISNGVMSMTVFLDRNDLHIGDEVRLKNEDTWWRIVEVYSAKNRNDVKRVEDFKSDFMGKIGNK